MWGVGARYGPTLWVPCAAVGRSHTTTTTTTPAKSPAANMIGRADLASPNLHGVVAVGMLGQPADSPGQDSAYETCNDRQVHTTSHMSYVHVHVHVHVDMSMSQHVHVHTSTRPRHVLVHVHVHVHVSSYHLSDDSLIPDDINARITRHTPETHFQTHTRDTLPGTHPRRTHLMMHARHTPETHTHDDACQTHTRDAHT